MKTLHDYLTPLVEIYEMRGAYSITADSDNTLDAGGIYDGIDDTDDDFFVTNSIIRTSL